MTDPNWWKSAVIYQVYPRSFKDSSGDGIGDLNGIIEKLDYIDSLNVDAVWVSPFFKSPMKDFGYDISDYRAIEPMFGTMDDFKRLLDEAHKRDLKVLIDQVWNHTSDQHPWFVESRMSRDNPKADWYVWADPKEDGTPPNNWLATFGGIAWTWDANRQQYYLHNFLQEQPDLNWYNPEVREAIKDIARFWLDLGVDGFRLDVVNFFTHDRQLRDNPRRPDHVPRPAGADPNDPFFSFINLYNFCRPETISVIQEIRRVTDEYPGTTTLAEISSAEDTIVISSEYVEGEKRLHMAYNSSLMSDEPLSYDRLCQMIKRFLKYFQDGTICWTAGTHDFPRLKSRWQKYLIDDEFSHEAFDHMFAALLISLPGSCCIYQGDELGLTQAQVPFDKMQDPYGIANYPHVLGRDGCRTPMPWSQESDQAGFTKAVEPWLPIPEEHLKHSVDQQESKSNSLLNKYRRLLEWRRQQPALQQGHLKLIETEDPIFAFTRECEKQKILCVFNLSPVAVHYDLSDFDECEDANETDFYNRRYEDTIELPGYGVFFGNFQAEVTL
jgi:alpha-glucosidase